MYDYSFFHKDVGEWFANALGEPTPVQAQGWPVIAKGRNVLMSAPTGTGKTLAAFLSSIDGFYKKKLDGSLRSGLTVLYISPLKSLTNDMLHNLKRPLEGLSLDRDVSVAVRNSDTRPYDRTKMVKRPPHILLTTPESLFVLLTSVGGRSMLNRVETVIVDELHAILDSKRGTHLTISLERLERMRGRPVQRIGLSATVKPLEKAAHYLAGYAGGKPRDVEIIAPKTAKMTEVLVTSPVPDMRVLPEGTIWPEICRTVYDMAKMVRTTLVFLNQRAQCEKVAFGVNSLFGGKFALTHHGCVSRDQRLEAEQMLKSGELRCLCATSSMELGIDVGEVDLVLQVAAPISVASGTQRMGRAGHSPSSVSTMHLLPRTAADALSCAFIAKAIAEGNIEEADIPMNCLDVLAQHLTSMAATENWNVTDMVDLIRGAYPYTRLTMEQTGRTLAMLYGDYDHSEEKPVSPKINYDRINGKVSAAPSSRLLATLSGGTIPNRGYYSVTTSDGTKLGELDEVFVFESRLGDKFMLGAFAWQIERVDRDRVIVRPATTAGATSPFWNGDWFGRKYEFGKKIGTYYALLEDTATLGRMAETLQTGFRMEPNAAANAARLAISQLKAVGMLQSDKRIVVEHFRDETGNLSMIAYIPFGGRVNLGLMMMIEHALNKSGSSGIQLIQSDDGIVVRSLSDQPIPRGLFGLLPKDNIVELLTELIPSNPLFSMVFRYNAARALMMGMNKTGRIPLWLQRLRSDETMQRAISFTDHPLVEETMKDCLDNYLDMEAIIEVVGDINSGRISVAEVFRDKPSPMAIEFTRLFEGMMMYEEPFPERGRSTGMPYLTAIAGSGGLSGGTIQALKPDSGDIDSVSEVEAPKDMESVHRMLMMGGDLQPGDADVSPELLNNLAESGRALYIEPGMWIAKEHEEQYLQAFGGEAESMQKIIRRMLRFRGAADAEGIADRYMLDPAGVEHMLDNLIAQGAIVPWENLYVHRDIYERASGIRRAGLRASVTTAAPDGYAAYLTQNVLRAGPPADLLAYGLNRLTGEYLPYERWEEAYLPARTVNYRPRMLDALLQTGGFCFRLDGENKLRFDKSGAALGDYPDDGSLGGDEKLLLGILREKGALFSQGIKNCADIPGLPDALLSLLRKGYVTNDSFRPVRLLDSGAVEGKAKVRHRVMVLDAGRWEALRDTAEAPFEETLVAAMERWGLLCRETAQRHSINWENALEVLRIWEYTGQVRRGYFVRGLSGAQFVLNDMATQVMHALNNPSPEYVCLAACDPDQAYGSILSHAEGASFICLPSVAVITSAGRPTMVLEKYGGVVRAFDDAPLASLQCFVKAFRQYRIWPAKNRIVVKNPGADVADPLMGAGFSRVAMDYALYRDQ